MASGIKDKVVILGMGCSKFGERWESSPTDLMVEAYEECLTDAGIERDQIEAACSGPVLMRLMLAPARCQCRLHSG